MGRLGKFGAGMMKKKADAMGDEFAQELRLQIVGPSAAPAVVQPRRGMSGRQKAIAAALVGGLLLLLAYYLMR